MSATILDGAAVANEILERTARQAAGVERAIGRKPCLATVLVGDDPASHTYVRVKVNRCRATGLDARRHEMPAGTGTAEVIDLVRALSADDTVDGILVQHPAPSGVDEAAVFDAISPAKDVDGLGPASFAAAALGRPGFLSCTPAGILALLDAYDVALAGRHAVVVGCSPILGRPLGLLLLGRDATVTYCHKRTADLASIVREADLVVAAAGRPGLVRGDWIKPGAVVVDAGYHPGGIGDVDHPGAAERAGMLTPVPGGVGPMTVATLLAQTVDAASAAIRSAG